MTTTLIHLCEQIQGQDALQPGRARVDRTKGIIFGVKIVGAESPNTHDTPGVTKGTKYTLEARKLALPIYEGIHVNVDHPPRKEPNKERSSYDRFAWLQDCYALESGNFGNLHFLDPEDPLAVRMMNAAEQKPDAFALSHNADGKFEIVDGWMIVHEIPEVRSVDIVTEGGTNKSLFEGLEVKTKCKLSALLEKAPAAKYPKLRKMVALWEAGGDMMLEADTEPDELDHLFAAFKKCLSADPEKANKILAMLKADEPEGEEEGETEESVEEGEEEAGGTLGDSTKKDPEGKGNGQTAGNKESRVRRRSTDPHVKAIQERLETADLKEWIRERCEAKEVACDKRLLESLVKIREKKAIDAHLDYLKENLPKKKTAPQSPRAVAPFRPGAFLEGAEAKQVNTVDEFVAALRG